MATAMTWTRASPSARAFYLRRFCTTTTAPPQTNPLFTPLPHPSPFPPCRPPWMLLPRTKQDETKEIIRLHSIRDNRHRDVHIPRGLRYTCCLGSSSDGWLVLLDKSYTPILLNPATGATSTLPSVENLDYLPGVLDPPPYPCSAGELELNPLANKVEDSCSYKAPNLEEMVYSGLRNGTEPRKLEAEKLVALNSIIYKREVPYVGTVVTDRGLYFGKTVVSLQPSSSSSILRYTALGIYGRKRQLAIARAGDKRWSSVKTQEPLFHDIIHHKGWFYAVHGQGSVEAIDPAAPPGRKTELLGAPEMRREPGKRYLVESGGDLFFINRLIGRVPIEPGKGGSGYRTSEFEVFKLDLNGPRWVEMRNLGNHSLFVGGNHSVSVSAEDLPELKGNRIYFTDDYWEHCLWFDPSSISDFGVFNMVNRSVEPLVLFDLQLCGPAPIWVIPPAASCDSVQPPRSQEELRELRGEQDGCRAPWLLFPRSKEDATRGICKLYSVQDKEDLSVDVPPGLRWNCCLGSSNGWLVTVDSTLTPHLTNPLTGSQIPLPSIDNLPGTESAHKLKLHLNHNYVTTDNGIYFGKVVVAWNVPSPSPPSPILPVKRDYTVVAIQGHERRLVCTREGDWSWSLLKTEHSGFQDVIHYNGMFYAVTGGRGFVEAFDLNGLLPNISEELLGPKMERSPQKRYLVESLGSLLLVARMFIRRESRDSISNSDSDIQQLKLFNDYDYEVNDKNVEYKTIGFRVFKLNLSDRKWYVVKNMGDQSLVLGSNQSLSISVSDYPDLRGNKIYFTDDHWEHSLSCRHVTHVDSGVFHFGDGTIEPLTPFDSHLNLPSPIFVIPTQYQKSQLR